MRAGCLVWRYMPCVALFGIFGENDDALEVQRRYEQACMEDERLQMRLEEQRRLYEQLEMIRRLTSCNPKPEPVSPAADIGFDSTGCGRPDPITDEDLNAGRGILTSPGPPGPQSPDVPKSMRMPVSSRYSAGKERIPDGPDTVSGTAAASLTSSHSSFPASTSHASLSSSHSSFPEAPAVDNFHDLDEIEEDLLSTVDEEDQEDWKNMQEQKEMAEQLEKVRKEEQQLCGETERLLLAEQNARGINEARNRAARKNLPFLWEPTGPLSFKRDDVGKSKIEEQLLAASTHPPPHLKHMGSPQVTLPESLPPASLFPTDLDTYSIPRRFSVRQLSEEEEEARTKVQVAQVLALGNKGTVDVEQEEEARTNAQVAQVLALEDKRDVGVVQWGAVGSSGGGEGSGEASHWGVSSSRKGHALGGSVEHVVQLGGVSSAGGGYGCKVEEAAARCGPRNLGVSMGGGNVAELEQGSSVRRSLQFSGDGGVGGGGVEEVVQRGAVSNSIQFFQEKAENKKSKETKIPSPQVGERGSSSLSISSIPDEQEFFDIL